MKILFVPRIFLKTQCNILYITCPVVVGAREKCGRGSMEEGAEGLHRKIRLRG